MNDAIRTLRKLIEFQTLSHDHRKNREALEWVRGILPKMDGDIESRSGFPMLYLSTREKKRPDLLLAAHIDVVEGEEKDFIPYEKDGRIYGRGVFDMKFAIAAYVVALNRLGSDLGSIDVGLLVTSDEETGGFNGTKAFLDDGAEPKLVILPDGSENWCFEEISKGVWHLRVESEGRAGHGAYPWEGDNAIMKLVSFLHEFEGFFPSEPCGSEEHRHSTINIGKIEGGLSVNRIPERAQALLDIRFVSPEEKREISAEMERLIKAYPGISIETLVEGNAHQIARDNPNLVSFSKVVEEICGVKRSFSLSHGSSDARFFAEKGIPVILTRPQGGGAHGKEEWIDIGDVTRFTEVIETFIRRQLIDKKAE